MTDTARQTQALAWFEGQHAWYAGNAQKARRRYVVAQGTAIVLTAITPVVVVVDWFPVEVRGLPAVVATIALALSNLFVWRENWLRFMQTAGALERERLWFDTHTGAYAGIEDADARLTQYVANASAIVSSEYAGWQQDLLSAKEAAEREST